MTTRLLLHALLCLHATVSVVSAFAVCSHDSTSLRVVGGLKPMLPSLPASSFSPYLVLRAASDAAAAAESEGGGGNMEEKEEKEPLTAEKIAELIEVAFVNACLQLAKGYVDVLKLFIVASKAGYEMGVPIPDLISMVEACPVQSANRPLMREELDLRNTWMNLVFMVLENVRHPTDNANVASTVTQGDRDKFEPLVLAVIAAGGDNAQESLTLDEVVNRGSADGLDFSHLNLSDPMEKAILSQNMRVITVTLTVLEEERRCYEEGGAGPAPRPPIPGTY